MSSPQFLTLQRVVGAILGARRALLAGAVVAVAGFVWPFVPDATAQPPAPPAQHWVGTWGTAPAGPPLPESLETFNRQTLRLIVHSSIGGKQVRIRVSNELGTAPLHIGSAHVALRQRGASIAPGSDRTLTFGGTASTVIASGAHALSDPVDLDVPAGADLAVSLYLPERVQAHTTHAGSFQINYVSPQGDFTETATLPVDRTITSWPFLTEVDVDMPSGAAIVAFGDSITEGAVTTPQANHRWPDLLALRLRQAGAHAKDGAPSGLSQLGVVNRGIGGNRLLRDPGEQPLFGKAGLARFDRDVLATAGVRYLVVLIGINDIGHPGSGKISLTETVSPQELIAGYRQLIARARAKGIAVYGATLIPFEGAVYPRWYTPEKEVVRAAINNWMRSDGEFDAIIDFDRAVRDPAHPTRMLPEYDCGDHVHPNDKGMQALADAIPLDLFRGIAPGERLAQGRPERR